MFKTITLIAILCIAVFTQTKTNIERPTGSRTFTATAFCLTGKMANGKKAGYGFVAADIRILPLGTSIFIQDMGIYTVADTGSAITKNRLDIWMPCGAARKFGRRLVQVKILKT